MKFKFVDIIVTMYSSMVDIENNRFDEIAAKLRKAQADTDTCVSTLLNFPSVCPAGQTSWQNIIACGKNLYKSHMQPNSNS